MRRIFIALPISEKLQNEILAWKEKWLKSQPAVALAKVSKIRWLSGKNLHITLIPPWYVSEGELKNVIASLAKQSEIATPRQSGAHDDSKNDFKIKFEKVEYGPDPHRPRLIWASGETPQQALDLKKRLENLLSPKSEYRPWKLHLTLARFAEEDFATFLIKKLDEKIDWQEKVDSIVIMESHLSRNGANYEILKKIPIFLNFL